MTKPDLPQRILENGSVLYLALKGGLLFFIAWNSMIGVDEFQQVGLAYYLDDIYQSIFPVKTTLYYYFYAVSHALSDSSVSLLMMARQMTAALGLVTLALLYGVARNMGRDRAEAVFVVCATLAFSTFFERIFRLRAEPLALFFAMAALHIISRSGKHDWRRFMVAGFIAGLAFLTTQKAVYFDLALGVALVTDVCMRRGCRSSIVTGLLFTSGWVIALFLYALHFRGFDFVVVIESIFTRPARIATSGGNDYEFIHIFVTQTLARNAPLYLLGAIGWLVAGRNAIASEGGAKIVWIFSGIITMLVFNHNQPWPYIFIWAMPFVALYIPSVFRLRWFKGERHRWIVALGIVALFASLPRNVHFVGHANKAQLEVVARAETLLADKNDTYMDGIGMVANRRQSERVWWDRINSRKLKTGEERESGKLAKAIAVGPKIWILTFRTELLKDFLAPYMDGSYIRIYPNILIAGTGVTDIAKTFQNRWGGTYRLYSADGRPSDVPLIIDGKKILGEIGIAQGTHSVNLVSGSDTRYLLPANIVAPFKIPPVRAPIGLYQHAYTY